jgi:hypothetical protein
MTRLVLAIVLCGSFLMPGCLYVDVKVPLDTDLDRTELGDRVGKSKMQSVLWLFAWGDAGTQAAAQDCGLTVIRHADQEIFSVLFGLYSSRTTVVYGD